MCFIPIFTRDDAEWRLFLDNKNVLAQFVRSLVDVPHIGAVHLLFGDYRDDIPAIEHSKVHKHIIPLAAWSMASQEPDHPRPDDEEFLPLGTEASLRWMVELKLITPQTRVCIIDFRNPLLTAVHIEEAIRAHNGRSDDVLLSAFRSIDHPCQANIPYCIEFFGLIHLLDPLSGLPANAAKHLGADTVVTRPFTFDWSKRNIPAIPGHAMHLQRVASHRVFYDPITTGEQWASALQNRALWRMEDDKARWVYSPESWRRICRFPDISGTTLPEVEDAQEPDGQAYIRPNPSGSGSILFLEKRSLQGKSLRMRLVPLALTGPVHNEFHEMELPQNVRQIALPSPQDHISGYLVSVLAETDFDAFDLLLPFIPDQQLWTYDSRLQHRVNCETGQPITGRQAFPRVFQPDGSFAIGSAQELESLLDEAPSFLRLYPLPQEIAKIDTYQMCLLRRNIRMKGDLRV